MEYIFKQKLEREDYVEFVYTHMVSNMFAIWKKYLLGISIIYLLTSPFLLDGSLLFMYVGVGIIVFITLLIIFMKRNAGRFYDKNSDEFAMTYTISEESFTYESNEGKLTKMWSEFYSARETDNILYLYVDKMRGIAIKKESAGYDAVKLIKKQITENIYSKKNIKFKK